MVNKNDITGIAILAVIVAVLCIGIFFAYPIVKDSLIDDTNDGDDGTDGGDTIIVGVWDYEEYDTSLSVGALTAGFYPGTFDAYLKFPSGYYDIVMENMVGIKFTAFNSSGDVAVAVLDGVALDEFKTLWMPKDLFGTGVSGLECLFSKISGADDFNDDDYIMERLKLAVPTGLTVEIILDMDRSDGLMTKLVV